MRLPSLIGPVMLVVVAGCAAAPPSSPAENPIHISARALPLDTYRLTDPQRGEIAGARRVLLGRCAGRLGLSLPSHRPVPETGPLSRTERRYGISDARLATTDGYHLGGRDPRTVDGKDRWLENVSANVESVLRGVKVDGSTLRLRSGQLYLGPHVAPDGGCLAEARSLLAEASHDPTNLVGKIDERSWEISRATPEVESATQAWSACMHGRGMAYPDPLTAGNDPRFRGPLPETLEINTAAADVACKNHTGLLERWYAQDVAVQRRLLRENTVELDHIRAADLRTLALARKTNAGW